jgi:hypothetical protein
VFRRWLLLPYSEKIFHPDDVAITFLLNFCNDRLVRRSDNFATFLCRLSRISGSPNLLEPYGPAKSTQGLLYFTPIIMENAVGIMIAVQRDRTRELLAGYLTGLVHSDETFFNQDCDLLDHDST